MKKKNKADEDLHTVNPKTMGIIYLTTVAENKSEIVG